LGKAKEMGKDWKKKIHVCQTDPFDVRLGRGLCEHFQKA
jgi:hypothetical protein